MIGTWKGVGFVGATALVVAGTCLTAEAGTIGLTGFSGGGRVIEAEIEYTFSNGQLAFDLRNLTDNEDMQSAGELLTGLRFTVSVTSGTFAQSSGVGDIVTLDDSGVIDSTDSDADILTDGHWALTNLGSGVLDLDWNGGAGPAYGIIGLDDNGDGTGGYNANGSLLADTHQPFVFYEGSFVITNSGFTAGSTLSQVTFYFGTDRENVASMPLPPAALLGLGLLGGLGALRARRRARARAHAHAAD